jgi:CRP/FNR family transcriptional regulator, cyclic AMP receptor protein
MFLQIDKYVNRCVALSDNQLDALHAVLEYRKVKKKTFLLHRGEHCNFEAYIVKGCVKVYSIDEKGDEVILMFAIEDWWVSDIASFSEGVPSTLYIETMEDCELLILTHDKKEQLYQQVPQLERMFRLMIQRAYTVLQNRFVATISQPAEERYLDFIKRYPSIPQRVPQHQIAAYLGISPEFLSKIRAKLSHRV